MRTLRDQVTKYLGDAHSIETQALAQLRTAPDIAGDPELSAMYREHLIETEGHERATRRALQARAAKPSRTKDTVMALGGKGFVLFARLQPDTPGKLHAHALSYEALELSSYQLLADVAERSGEQSVVDTARRIAAEERGMMTRLEGTFGVAVDASLRSLGLDDLNEQLRKYLADAHALEEQAIALLERGPKLAGSERLSIIYEAHLAESRDHAELVEESLHRLGGDPSTLKDASLRLGALNWSAFFRGHPDTPGKLAAFVRAFEHLEIGAYEQLKRVAERAGDEHTADIADRILEQERDAAGQVEDAFAEAVEVSLAAQGITV
jgi:ferritin-like metal-binding protein YciE